jgi:hypothetical protein
MTHLLGCGDRPGETRGMETYQSQDRHEAICDNGMPAIAVAHTPLPLCTGLLAGNDSEHNGQLFTPGAPAQVIRPMIDPAICTNPNFFAFCDSQKYLMSEENGHYPNSAVSDAIVSPAQ